MAANLTIEPIRQLARRVPTHAVYTRDLWGVAWDRQPWLFVDSVSWNLPPAIGTATFRWRYGEGMRQGEPSIGWVQRLSGLHRHWVRISFTLAPEEDGTPRYLHWYGMLDVFGEEKAGLVRQVIPTGEQPIVAYSLEHAFYKSPVRKSIWRNATSGAEKTIDRALVFNAPRADGSKSGNRSADRGMRIEAVRLLAKSGGSSGDWQADDADAAPHRTKEGR